MSFLLGGCRPAVACQNNFGIIEAYQAGNFGGRQIVLAWEPDQRSARCHKPGARVEILCSVCYLRIMSRLDGYRKRNRKPARTKVGGPTVSTGVRPIR